MDQCPLNSLNGGGVHRSVPSQRHQAQMVLQHVLPNPIDQNLEGNIMQEAGLWVLERLEGLALGTVTEDGLGVCYTWCLA